MTNTVRIEVVVRVDGAEFKTVAPVEISRPTAPIEKVPTPKPSPASGPVNWVDFLPNEKLSDMVREIVLNALRKNEGNRTHTARGLGISLRGLRNMINEFEAKGFDVPESKYVGFGWAHVASAVAGYPAQDKDEDERLGA